MHVLCAACMSLDCYLVSYGFFWDKIWLFWWKLWWHMLSRGHWDQHVLAGSPCVYASKLHVLESIVDGGASISWKPLNTFRLLILVCLTALVSCCFTAVVPKVGGSKPLGVLRNSRGWWSRNGRLGGSEAETCSCRTIGELIITFLLSY